MYLKSAYHGTKLKAAMSRDLCSILGLYLACSCVWKMCTNFEDGKLLESV